MKFDNNNMLYMEHDLPDMNAAVGDSCAETGRYFILNCSLNKIDIRVASEYMSNTESNDKYVRHPRLSDQDFGPDQWLPRYLVSKICGFGEEASRMRKDYKSMSLSSLACVCPVFAKVFVLLQELAFRLPFRWSDSKRAFESNKDASADYLNWFMLIVYYKIKPRFVTKEELKAAVQAYYKPETDLGAATFNEFYFKAADEVWK